MIRRAPVVSALCALGWILTSGFSQSAAEGYPNTADYGHAEASGAIEPLPPIDPIPLPNPQVEPIPAPEDAGPGETILDDGLMDSQTIAEIPPPRRSWLQRECCLWDGSFEAGINGTSGNTDTVNLRSGLHAKRKGRSTTLSLDMLYRRDNEDGEQTVNRLFTEGRNEWRFAKSPWTGYAHSVVEFDEFTAWDSRVTFDMGWGYRLWDTEVSEFIARFGSGFSREFGGPDEAVVPEGVLGLDFDLQISKRQTFEITADYFPDWTMWGEYRMNAKANWKMMLDSSENLALKVGVIDRYDSTPGGLKPNDLDYSMTLLWSF
jgi:putative salt-induced outer membrane protein YdiY